PGLMPQKTTSSPCARTSGTALGGFGGIALAAGARWSFRGKDAGSVRTWKVRARLRTPHRGERSVPAAQTVFRRALLTAAGGGAPLRRAAPVIAKRPGSPQPDHTARPAP